MKKERSKLKRNQAIFWDKIMPRSKLKDFNIKKTKFKY